MPQISILVVDDDHDVREYLREALTSEGYGVTVLDDPTGVVDELERGDYHIVVLDLTMPKLSGVDLLGRLRDVDDEERLASMRRSIRELRKARGLTLKQMARRMEPSRRN